MYEIIDLKQDSNTMCLNFPCAYFEQLIYDYRYQTVNTEYFQAVAIVAFYILQKFTTNEVVKKKHILQQGLHKEVLMTLPFSRFRASIM